MLAVTSLTWIKDIAANVDPRSRILSTTKKEATHPSEASVLTRSTECASYCYRCSLHADYFTLKMEATHSSETSVVTRPTRFHIPGKHSSLS
jgi:hypothetical protein